MTQRKTLLRQLRRLRELTLEALSKETGVPVSSLSRMERGLVRPTAPQQHVLAGYFGRPIDELLGPASDIAA